MKKLYSFNVMSEDVFCVDCKRPLKKRIAELKPTANRCFKHFVIFKARGDGNKFKGYSRKHTGSLNTKSFEQK